MAIKYWDDIFEYFAKFLEGRKSTPTLQTDSEFDLLDNLYTRSEVRGLTLEPQKLPSSMWFEEGNNREVWEQTINLQPYLNSKFIGFSFDEKDGEFVTLGTYDQPDIGRTYGIRHGTVAVGEMSVVADNFGSHGWADMRLRLHYPIEYVSAAQVHYLITEVVRMTFDEHTADDQFATKAETKASRAMLEALWGARSEGLGTVIQVSSTGSWGHYKATLDNWQTNGVDPWKRFEGRRGAI